MAVVQRTVTVRNKQGLHARPAALFVQAANKYDAHITVLYGTEKVNGKSIMGILMLGAEQGAQIVLEADGIDAENALAELETLITKEEEA